MVCSRCGYCCTLIPKVTFWEIFRIMLKGHLNFAEKDVSGGRCIKMVKGDCYFLARLEDGTTACRIYDIRPKVCRDFPGTEECSVDKRSFRERIIT